VGNTAQQLCNSSNSHPRLCYLLTRLPWVHPLGHSDCSWNTKLIFIKNMSLYQYQYPHHPSSSYISPQPAFIDPASFRRDYSSRLEQLQFNSRPIIQNLSFYAQEYSRYADLVAQCIDSHIRKVSCLWPGLYCSMCIPRENQEAHTFGHICTPCNLTVA